MSRPASGRTKPARPEAIRGHNLGLVLSEVHRAGTRSRAELTRQIGLNRSTIGALVAELGELGLLTERRPDTHRRAGRPSHVVEPALPGPFALAVAVEIDTLVVAAVGLGGTVLARIDETVPETRRTPAHIATRCARLAHAVVEQLGPVARPIGMGISVPGTVRRYDGSIEHAPNLGWRDVPMPALISDRLEFGVPVRVGNDADLGALSEHLRGVARDCANLVFINGRIGVGGGVIVDGHQLHGAGGFAGEFGHMVIDPAGLPCHCGNAGCWETRIGEQRLLTLAGHTTGPGPVAVQEVMAAAAAGEPSAVAALTEVGEWIGLGLAALTNVFNPEMIVVGGTLATLLATHHDCIRAALDRAALPGPAQMVSLVTPAFGAESSLLGAAELAFQHLLDNPLAVMAGRVAG